MASHSSAKPRGTTTTMSMEHKAFAFDWSRFEFDLHPLLLQALADNETAELEAYVGRHFAELKDPYEGKPLSGDWRDALGNRDVHEYGDYTLTRFYDPDDCSGVGHEWTRLNEELPELVVNALLGFQVGPPDRLFDPGRYGSYFQTPACVRASLAALTPIGAPELARFVELLERCAADGRGLYATF